MHRTPLIALLFTACISTTFALTPRPRPTTPAPTPAAVVVSRPNPLLPPQINLAGLYPDIAGQLLTPTFAPRGITPLYTQQDWNAYRQLFSADLDPHRAGNANELAAKFIATAEVDKRPGLCRLLLIRALATTYRNAGGWAQAGRALDSFQKKLDINDPAQLAALWTMADTLSRYSTTPKPDRLTCSAIAAKANVQLSLLLLNLGQLDAAQSLIKKAAYHEGWLKTNPRLRSQIAAARATINATASLMESLRTDFQAVVAQHDESAAFRIYLFAKFVRPSPGLLDDLLTRRNAKELQETESALAAGDRDPTAAYAAGESLRRTAESLPDGMLRQRTLYAAMHYYKIFLHDPANEGERIKRTLAQMQVQNLASDGARGPTTIRPYDPPPVVATQPAAHPPTPPARPTRAITHTAIETPTPNLAPAPGMPSMPIEEPPTMMAGTAERPVG